MNRTRVLIGALIALAGAGWTFQGLNATFVPTSFMTGSSVWVVIGLATFAAGVALIVSARRS